MFWMALKVGLVHVSRAETRLLVEVPVWLGGPNLHFKDIFTSRLKNYEMV